MNASAAANGQLLSPENAQYSSGDIIWNFGPPSSTGVANAFMHRMKHSTAAISTPGSASGNTMRQNARDGAALTDVAQVEIVGLADAEVVLVDAA